MFSTSREGEEDVHKPQSFSKSKGLMLSGRSAAVLT
jgi:hypothetical protein